MSPMYQGPGEWVTGLLTFHCSAHMCTQRGGHLQEPHSCLFHGGFPASICLYLICRDHHSCLPCCAQHEA